MLPVPFPLLPSREPVQTKGSGRGGRMHALPGQRRGPGATEHTVHTAPALTPGD